MDAKTNKFGMTVEEALERTEEVQRELWLEKNGPFLTESDALEEYRFGFRKNVKLSKKEGHDKEFWLEYMDGCIGRDIVLFKNKIGDFSYKYIQDLENDPHFIKLKEIIQEQLNSIYGE